MFDLRPFNHVKAGQLNCDAAPLSDREHNCVPRAFTAAMAMLGYPDVDPEAYTNLEYPNGNLQGETFASAVDFINRRPDLYPDPPSIAIGAFDAAVAEAAGEAGFPVVVSGRVVCASVRFAPWGTCEHASILEAHADDGWSIWNSWAADVETYGTSDLAALDSMAIIQRSVFPRPAPLNEEDDMPAEVPFPPIPIGPASVYPFDLAEQINTSLVRCYVRLRATGSVDATAHVLAVRNTDGVPEADIQLTAKVGGASADWHLPDGLDCNIVVQTGSGLGAIAYKVGRK